MADTATAQNESVGNTSNNFEILLTKKPKTKEEAIEILRDIQSTGNVGIRDIPNKSPLGKAITEFSGGLKYISIGAMIADLQKKTVAAGIKVEKEDKIDVDLETAKTTVDEKIKKAAEKVSKDLGGNDKLNQLVKEETEKLVKEREIKTKKEAIEGIQEKLANEMGTEVNDEIRVKSREVFEEARNIEKNNPQEVNQIKRNTLMKEIEDEYDKANPEGISEEQRKLVKEQASMAADTYYGGKTIDSETRDVVLAGSMWQGQANLGQYWTDTEGVIKLLQKTPNEVKDLQGKYAAVKEGLSSLIQPTNVRELASFDSIMGSLGGQQMMADFNLGQSRLLSMVDNFNSLTGGAIGRAFGEMGSNFISRVGTESVKSFAENSLKVFAEKGFQQGFSTVLNGVLSGGAKAAVTSAATTAAATAATTAGSAAATAAGVASGPVGWLALAGKLLLDGLKKLGKGLSDMITDGRGNDEDVNKVAKKWWLLIIILPAILMMSCSTTMISTLPPTQVNKKGDPDEAGEYGTITVGNITVPTCDPKVNTRAILREIAYSVKGKVVYDRNATWRCIGACPKWGKDHGVDCAKLVSWVWLQCTGKGRSGEFGTTNKLVSSLNHRVPGWQRVYPNSLSDLKIGDMLVRLNTCSDGGRCNHAAIYIGNTTTADGRIVGEVLETVGNGGDPIITKVYSVSPNGIRLYRDRTRYIYPYIIRITNVFND